MTGGGTVLGDEKRVGSRRRQRGSVSLEAFDHLDDIVIRAILTA
jgi:hypothetical protein